MLDIHTGPAAGRSFPVIRDVEFFRIELSRLNDGHLFVSVTATTVDQQEPQLLDQEIACGRAASIDDVLAVIREHVRFIVSAPN